VPAATRPKHKSRTRGSGWRLIRALTEDSVSAKPQRPPRFGGDFGQLRAQDLEVMLAQDNIVRHWRPYTRAEALHMNPVAMFYQSKQWMFLLRAYHIGD
jgi:hypothetical protein